MANTLPENWLPIALLALAMTFVVSNVLAVWAGTPNPERTKRSVPWLQRSTTAQLALMAWLMWGFALNDGPLALFGLLMAVGLTVAFIADLVMAKIIPTPNRVLFGIGLFSITHICYLLAFALAAPTLAPSMAAPGDTLTSGLVIGLVVVGFVVWLRLVFNPDKPRPMNYGALAYVVLICVMTALALRLTIANPLMWPLGVGAALFLLSDVILGNQIYRENNWRWVSEVVWALYITGQAGLTLGVWVAVGLT